MILMKISEACWLTLAIHLWFRGKTIFEAHWCFGPDDWMKCCLMMTWGRYSAPRSLCLSVCRHAVVIAQFVFRLQTSSSTAIFWWSRWPPSHWWHRWHMYTTHIDTHVHMHKHTHAITHVHTHTHTYTHKHTYATSSILVRAVFFMSSMHLSGPYFNNEHQNQVHPNPYKGNQIHPDSCFSLSSPECPYILIISFRSL